MYRPDTSPLLRLSAEDNFPSQINRTHHLNRSMSLKAALLAFPLPQPSIPTTLHRQSTLPARPSPLHAYNANYSRLRHARSTRVLARQSLVREPDPPYTMPSSYAKIRSKFPPSSHVDSAHPETIRDPSLIVERDESRRPSFEIYDDYTPTLRRSIPRRHTLRRTLGIADIATR